MRKMENTNAVQRTRLQVAILGEPAVGKTSILNRYLFDTFSMRYNPSLGDSYTFQVDDPQGNTTYMRVADIPGGNRVDDLWVRTIEQTDAFVFIYSVDNYKSFQEVVDLREHVFSIKESGVPSVVVANKLDLPRLSWFEGSNVIQKVLQPAWDTAHFGVSAKEDLDMTEIFDQLVNDCQKGLRRPSRGRRSMWAYNSLMDVLDTMHKREESSHK